MNRRSFVLACFGGAAVAGAPSLFAATPARHSVAKPKLIESNFRVDGVAADISVVIDAAVHPGQDPPPELDPLLRACGMRQIAGPRGTTTYRWFPDASESCTIEVKHPDSSRTVVASGCRGAFKVLCQAPGVMRFEFAFTGLLAQTACVKAAPCQV